MKVSLRRTAPVSLGIGYRGRLLAGRLRLNREAVKQVRGAFYWDGLMFSDPLGKQHYSNQAHAWTAAQAERLGVTPDAIEATIRRGWLADEIDATETAAELLLEPPDRDVFGLKVVRG